MNDSGMSDSQFMRFQKNKHERINKYIDNYNKDIKVRQISERWKSAKIEKKTLWERLTSWITR
jgi:hypothetical protein